MAKGASALHDGAWTLEPSIKTKGGANAALVALPFSYCRFDVVFFLDFPKLVSTDAPMLASICLAASA